MGGTLDWDGWTWGRRRGMDSRQMCITAVSLHVAFQSVENNPSTAPPKIWRGGGEGGGGREGKRERERGREGEKENILYSSNTCAHKSSFDFRNNNSITVYSCVKQQIFLQPTFFPTGAFSVHSAHNETESYP